MSSLSAWQNFYIIVGSSAGALTGLTFVVATLMQSAVDRPSRGLRRAVAAYTTPTIVHFGGALFVCAVLSAPWPALVPVSLLLGLCGLWGIGYVGVVLRRIHQLELYDPVVEDWVWYGILPLLAYVALVVTAILLMGNAARALFGTGGALVLLLFLGIHNAWDAVTYITLELPQRSDGGQAPRQLASQPARQPERQQAGHQDEA